MRNSKLLDSLAVPAQSELQDTSCLSVDCDTGHVYCATKTHLVGLDPGVGQVTAFVSLVDQEYLPADGSASVIGVQYLVDQRALCAATTNGNLLLWNVDMADLECVGSVESGFTAMAWSPDLELVVLTTGQDTILMMTREFDPITETPIHTDTFGEAEFVQVGWGKKETQFHGSEGKEAAKRKTEEVGVAKPWDDRKPRISWRGDGQFFVVSTISPQTGARQLRVWSRDCAHHSTSENVDGIEQALSWKPSGSLIATSQRRPNKHDIVFFERNGLRHGEFTLPFGVKEVKVKEVLWNLDSTVLAVWCEDLAPDGASEQFCSQCYVQLWTTGNYHWYLKQSLHFPGTADDTVVALVWDPEQAYRLHIMCQGGQYFQYTWSWTTNGSKGRTDDDQALIAVIDGVRVLMTPLRNMVVPPPMSAYYLQMPCAVNQVAFAPPPNSNDLAVFLVDGRIALYRFTDDVDKVDQTVKTDGTGGTGFTACCKTPHLQGVYSIGKLSESEYPLKYFHCIWIASDIILQCSSDIEGHHSVIHQVAVEASGISLRCSTPVEGYVHDLAYNPDSGSVAVQLTDGSLFKYDPVSETVFPWVSESGDEAQFPVPCSQMAVCQQGEEEVVLGLTDRFRFYVNGIEVASNCTSFSVHDEFLLLTTLTHTCRCISRHTQVKVLPTLSDGKAHPFDESVRRVERGSRIVAVVADDTKLVVQMPRGNLETVHPRALVLSSVRKHLDRRKFKEAFIIMRKHRINMNLIYDHNPSVFLDNVTEFLQQIEAVNHINLFLTDLLEEDVTVTMYTAAYNRSAPTPGDTSDSHNKVDTICDAIRKGLCAIDENKYLLSILTSYVRKTKPELSEALHMVKTLRESKEKSQFVSAEEALKYLLFLVDVNELYDIALGTYDFDLVLMVAEKSHKDPKEYIPFLNNLRRLEANYQRYTIDKYLKRYQSALQNISKCGDEHFEECLTLVHSHQLFNEALKLFPVGSNHYKEIANAFGEYLTEKRRHEDAGTVYMKAENWEPALHAFKTCNQWQQAFCMTAQLQYSKEQEASLARDMAGHLKDKGRHAEAAIILEQYADDIEEAIVTLIEGAQWNEALRLMHKYRRTDFVETNLKGALVERYQQELSTLEGMQEEFERYKNRLKVVRVEKEKARLEMLEAEGHMNQADADLFSDTSSATGESVQSAESSRSSVYSKMSGRSVRNRRKATHKKWKLKEGSQYEDMALIAAMAKIITFVDGLRNDINLLLKALIQFHYDTEAAGLQLKYDSFLTSIEKSVPQIWLEEEESRTFQPVLGPNVTANTIAQAMQQGKTMRVSDDEEPLDPVIKTAPTLQKDVKWKLYSFLPET